MRRFGPLLLVVIIAIIAGVAVVYRSSKARQEQSAPAIPKALPSETSAAARDWCYSQTQNHRTVAEICAKSFRQIKSPSRLYLEGVDVKVFADDGATFDHVQTATAEFDTENGDFYADGEVEITAGQPVGDRPPARRVFIKTSGLKYESKTGRASTDRPTVFPVRARRGQVGRSLLRARIPRASAALRGCRHLAGKQPQGQTADRGNRRTGLQGEGLRHHRGPVVSAQARRMVVEGGKGILRLKEGDIRRIEASQARGTDRPEPDRQVEYAAEQIFIDFGAGGEVEHIAADRTRAWPPSKKPPALG